MNAYYRSAFITLIFIPLITLLAEFSESLKNGLKTIFWHHWLGKGILVIVLFIVLSFLWGLKPSKSLSPEEHAIQLMRALILSLIGSGIIFLFFVSEYFELL